jgi:hypothetical protein
MTRPIYQRFVEARREWGCTAANDVAFWQFLVRNMNDIERALFRDEQRRVKRLQERAREARTHIGQGGQRDG